MLNADAPYEFINVSNNCMTKSAVTGRNITWDGINFIFSPQKKIGDINGDGVINVADLVLLSRYIAELETLTDTQLKAADVNGDGKVNIADLVRLARWLANLEPTPLGQPLQ